MCNAKKIQQNLENLIQTKGKPLEIVLMKDITVILDEIRLKMIFYGFKNCCNAVQKKQ